jgi:hypothetical protein
MMSVAIATWMIVMAVAGYLRFFVLQSPPFYGYFVAGMLDGALATVCAYFAGRLFA